MKKTLSALLLTLIFLQSFSQTQIKKAPGDYEIPERQETVSSSSHSFRKSNSDNFGAEKEVDTRISLGVISSLPIGDFGKTNQFETGTELRMSVGVLNTVDVTASVGYLRDISSNRSNSFSQINYKLGLKCYVISGEYEYDGLYLGLNGGGSFSKKQINNYNDFKNKLVYSPYIGYTWKKLDFDFIMNNLIYDDSKKLISLGVGVSYRL